VIIPLEEQQVKLSDTNMIQIVKCKNAQCCKCSIVDSEQNHEEIMTLTFAHIQAASSSVVDSVPSTFFICSSGLRGLGKEIKTIQLSSIYS
jgi:hypothetical protein